ncbi:hypothetical protein [Arthrobacter mobilis]|uniref:Superoxide dismutase n=1 Tax=Arthrobacter mobilis TaxID=2724944 RepID=A0A7X6K5D2_9MICC|nr:hypothetical protein [Arthrobacter mobilis]NKX53645.1 hypothetical protein [Arthrobacter mobilis]
MPQTASRPRRALPAVFLTALTAVGLLAACAEPAAGPSPAGSPLTTPAATITLPGATSAEGITAGEGGTFYAGDLLAGDIFQGSLDERTAERFIDAPQGRMAAGMAADVSRDLLFVAGGSTGQGFVYGLADGADVRTYEFADPETSFINDVAVTADSAWFTNSRRGVLYTVPLEEEQEPGKARTVELTGPAAETPGDFNLNGIVATDDGRLIVAHSANEAVYTVDPETGASKAIEGLKLPHVDGLVLEGRVLWAVQNLLNQISRITLDEDITSGTLDSVITSDLFQTPTTAALVGNKLLVVNAKFDTGFPPTAETYEVVVVNAR